MDPTSQRVLSDLLFDVLCAVKLVDGRPLILLPHVWYREENPLPFERSADSVAGERRREHGTIILGVQRGYMGGGGTRQTQALRARARAWSGSVWRH